MRIIAPTPALFTLIPGECLKPKTEWRMTQSEANPSLDYGSLLAGKKSREQCFFGLPEGTGAPKNDCSTSLFGPVSLLKRTGKLDGQAGKYY